MRRDIHTFIKNCEVCQKTKVPTTKSPGLLQPLPVPTTVFDSVSMDFITHLPVTTTT